MESILVEILSVQQSTWSDTESNEDDAPKNYISPVITQLSISAHDYDSSNEQEEKRR